MGRHLCARRQFSYPKRQTTPKNMMRSAMSICVSLLLAGQDKPRADSLFTLSSNRENNPQVCRSRSCFSSIQIGFKLLVKK
jgi:hypothetical protein